MSFFTALNLSFKNLWSKKGRTFMTSFAGSIGIIGVALVLAISNGFQGYIDKLQSDTLSAYPVSISYVALDYAQIQKTMEEMGKEQEKGEEGKLNVYDLQAIMGQMAHYNYLSSDFVDYIEDYRIQDLEKDENRRNLNALSVNYSMPLNILTQMGPSVVKMNTTATTSSLSGSTSSLFFQAVDKEFVLKSYDVHGNYPANKNEVAIVLGSDSSISVQSLMTLGFTASKNAEGVYEPVDYMDFIGKEYAFIPNNDFYDSANNFAPAGQSDYSTLYANKTADNTLKVTAVLVLKENAPVEIFEEGVMYLESFAEYYRQNCSQSEVAIQTKALSSQVDIANSSRTKLIIPYQMDISELSMMMGSSDAITKFEYVEDMINYLNGTFKMQLTVDQVLDIALQMVGASSIPTGIYAYTNSFDAKQNFIDYVNDWNKTETGKTNEIVYTDATQILTESLGQLIDIISYVLIAFAAVSLVVSSIMIGIITYVSVIERTREIGVLRSMGARKKDISRVFNAETVLIGFAAGLIGVLVTYIFCPIINAIIWAVAGSSFTSAIAVFNPLHALILVLISMALTLIGGSIPSGIAAKKDPVVALRSE